MEKESFNIADFLFNTPIYSKVEVNDTDVDDFNALFFDSTRIIFEGFNPKRKVQSTFIVNRHLNYSNNSFFRSGGIEMLTIECKRYNDKFWFFILWNSNDNIIQKVGQFPSVADFHIGEIKQYTKILPEARLREFTRAVGLAANGVGIGSFVYLRRIFEYLILEAYSTALGSGVISDQEFTVARMDEKINLLRDFLPNFLVESKSMYSILSLGIHELEEETCLRNFDVLRVGIEIILDEKLEESRKRTKIELAKKTLGQVASALKKTS